MNLLTVPASSLKKEHPVKIPIPDWLVKEVSSKRNLGSLPKILKEAGLRTVCQAARCPNIGECFSRGTATFLILGDICRRQCRFCSIKKRPSGYLPVDKDEPARIAQTVQQLGLGYVVVTSVSRDDLPDGGAEHFARTIRKIKSRTPGITVEVLIPDFSGHLEALKTVVKERPEVINHNLETVEPLYPKVRPQADYKRSLELLRRIKGLDARIFTKSGLILGLGEEKEEIQKALNDLQQAQADILTLGQYLQPTVRELAVEKYLTRQEFAFWQKAAEALGFLFVASGNLVRSSYRAEEAYKRALSRSSLSRFQGNDIT